MTNPQSRTRPPTIKKPARVEDVTAAGLTPNAAVILVLEHALARAMRGDVRSVAVVLETPGQGYDCKMSGPANLAEQLGRLRLIEEEILRVASDEGAL